MKKKNVFVCTWFVNFLGVGYLLDNMGWHVFPIFSNPSDHKKIWDEQIEPINENDLRLRFIEDAGEYRFLLYAHPFPSPKKEYSFGLYRGHMDISKIYLKFKKESKGMAFFRFALLGTTENPTISERSKLITDIKFMKIDEIVKNSPEWMAVSSQQLAKVKKL